MSGTDTPAPRPDATGDDARMPLGTPDPNAETQSVRLPPSLDAPSRFPFVLGPYEVVRELGRGGMGAVFLAVHIRLKKPVAVKVLSPARIHSPEATARFEREMQALGTLSHPNVVGATDAGEAGGRLYLVMEYVDGVDLATLVRLHGPLSVADAAELIRQAAVGLQYIHENGRVHRDVKPSNLMLSAGGEVKILDLGLALLGGVGPDDGELTGSGAVMGTADYMAPEQWADSHHVDIRADVYSLGCTLYKLLTGKAPFTTSSPGAPASKRAAHAQAPVPPIKDLPAPLQAALQRMLAKAPAERFAAPAEVAEAMRPFAAGADLRRLAAEARRRAGAAPVVVAPAPPTPLLETGPPSAPARIPRRWRALAAVLTLAVLTLAGLALAAFFFWPHPAPPPPPPAVVPFPLVWPKEEQNSAWRWLPDRSELHVSCDQEGLIRLGETAHDYAFEIDFHQANWGGAGVFFGYHPDRIEGKPCTTFQVLQLVKRSMPGGDDAFFLQWTEHHHWADGGAGVGAEVFSRVVLQGGDQRLSIAVKEGKLVRAAWNGADLAPDLLRQIGRADSPPSIPSGLNCAGPWGAYCFHGTAFFHNPHPLSPGD